MTWKSWNRSLEPTTPPPKICRNTFCKTLFRMICITCSKQPVIQKYPNTRSYLYKHWPQNGSQLWRMQCSTIRFVQHKLTSLLPRRCHNASLKLQPPLHILPFQSLGSKITEGSIWLKTDVATSCKLYVMHRLGDSLFHAHEVQV